MVSRTKKIVGFFVEGYKDRFTKDYNVYDDEGSEGGLRGTCIFCDIVMKDNK